MASGVQRTGGVLHIRTDTVAELSRSRSQSFSSDVDTYEAVQKEDSRMRQTWDKVMCKEMGIPDRYQHVAVLIVRWVKGLDPHMDCEEEVSDLDSQSLRFH